jgi:hypothetical protein
MKNPFKKTPIINTGTTSRQFSYQKGEVSLNFGLRTDIKTQLKDFLELLKVATKEVEEEIKK